MCSYDRQSGFFPRSWDHDPCVPHVTPKRRPEPSNRSDGFVVFLKSKHARRAARRAAEHTRRVTRKTPFGSVYASALYESRPRPGRGETHTRPVECARDFFVRAPGAVLLLLSSICSRLRLRVKRPTRVSRRERVHGKKNARKC